MIRALLSHIPVAKGKGLDSHVGNLAITSRYVRNEFERFATVSLPNR